MQKLLLVFIGLIVGAIGGWQVHSFVQEPVQPSEKFVFTDKLRDAQVPYLSATGTWRGMDLANKVNTVRIVCDLAEQTCEMNQANIMSSGITPFLSLYYQSFRITQLNAESLTAVDNLPYPCISQTLLIDRKAKAVSLVRTKSNHQDLCALVRDEPVTISLVDPQ